MGRPLVAASRQSGVGLVSTYIEYLGTREPNNDNAIRNGRPESVFRASLEIGASCINLVTGADKTADTTLESVRDRMQTHLDMNGRVSGLGPTAVQLKLIAEMLLERDDPEAAQRFQTASHHESVSDIRNLRPLCRRNRWTGVPTSRLGEHVLSGLTTRYAGPGTLAVPALLHHDQGRRKIDNTDILVANSGTNGGPSVVRRAQLKGYCLGFCGDEEREAEGDEARSEYMEDIVLVSGHCDLVDPTTGHTMNGLAKRLERESRGEASPEQIDMLNEATLHVLQTITDPEPWRMGAMPMARTPEFSFG
jgi:hypothetical protein